MFWVGPVPNHLITGLPGAGKTLRALSKVVLPLVGSTVELENGQTVPRRICVAGVRDLLIDHEPVTNVEFDQERGKILCRGEWIEPETERRSPGEPPHDCEVRSDNWWRWCQPGDVIVLDECQRLFRPMASGRRLPLFITMLETHRHFGVDFVFITQHPNLLHTNVRNLVNLHQHVRRALGGATTLVYEWDHCHNPNTIRDASASIWRHDKAAFSLYKSAEVHTKLKHRVPFAVYVLLFALVALPASLYAARERVFRDRLPGSAFAAGPQSSASSPRALPVSHSSGHSRPRGFVDVPELAGCYSVGASCRCMDRSSRWVVVSLPMCQLSSSSYDGLVPWSARPAVDGRGYGAAAGASGLALAPALAASAGASL